jgi:UDP-N-acetylmuramate dehydrogenase
VTLDTLAHALEAAVPGGVTRDASVAELTTYRLGGPVAVLVRVHDESQLARVAGVLGADPAPLLVVGRGSNLLVADRGFAGVGLLLAGEFEALEIDRATGTVTAGGALALPVLARRTAAAGLTGLEFYVGIPGSVGGAVRMNAGGHGRDTRAVLRRAWVAAIGEDAVPRAYDAAALDLSYRHSRLGDRDVVTRAELAAEPDAPARCEARITEVVRWRRDHQPGGSNAGSVFRNPPGDSAGRLIDAAGLKGLRVGGAVVSQKHANFFQAEPGATADDVRRLVDEVRTQVVRASGVTLEPELRMIGFEDHEPAAAP